MAAVAVSRCVIRVELPEPEGRIVRGTEAMRNKHDREKEG